MKPPVAIAPKLTMNNGSTTATRVIPVVPLAGADCSTNGATLFLAPCDNNGQITHFVLTTAGPSVALLTPNKVLFSYIYKDLPYPVVCYNHFRPPRRRRLISVGVFMNAISTDVAKTISNHLI